MKQRQPKVMPDAAHPGMWRVRWPDGRLSDMKNLTRAKDAVTCFMETEERHQRGRHSPLEGQKGAARQPASVRPLADLLPEVGFV